MGSKSSGPVKNSTSNPIQIPSDLRQTQSSQPVASSSLIEVPVHSLMDTQQDQRVHIQSSPLEPIITHVSDKVKSGTQDTKLNELRTIEEGVEFTHEVDSTTEMVTENALHTSASSSPVKPKGRKCRRATASQGRLLISQNQRTPTNSSTNITHKRGRVADQDMSHQNEVHPSPADPNVKVDGNLLIPLGSLEKE
ncbi:DCD (Development and Cell Death) domain protein [Striga asiatica]|uniref:DCD (Development and Cell Death) domain protein n=1 Tax=Striga asiatica TaxID=4170 RepID=A0A5A7Q921_STRAF|nr:DCD (Development and Cell Death) domain protein [Striga asiatica]